MERLEGGEGGGGKGGAKKKDRIKERLFGSRNLKRFSKREVVACTMNKRPWESQHEE